MDVKVTAAVGRSIVNNASVTGDSMFGASIASDPVLPSDDSSTAASVVAVTLPATGWSLVKQWLEAATWLLLLGGFTLVIGRRRHPTPMF